MKHKNCIFGYCKKRFQRSFNISPCTKVSMKNMSKFTSATINPYKRSSLQKWIATEMNLLDVPSRKKICRLFHVLAPFFFTVSETELDYYRQNVNVRVVSWVTEQLTENQEISRKSLPRFELIAITQLAIQKTKFAGCAKKMQQISCKTFHTKIYFT